MNSSPESEGKVACYQDLRTHLGQHEQAFGDSEETMLGAFIHACRKQTRTGQHTTATLVDNLCTGMSAELAAEVRFNPDTFAAWERFFAAMQQVSLTAKELLTHHHLTTTKALMFYAQVQKQKQMADSTASTTAQPPAAAPESSKPDCKQESGCPEPSA